MLRYIALRLLTALPIVAFVVIFIFLMLHLAPGDPAALVAGDNATPQQLDAIRARLHLDQPLVSQFWLWLAQLSQLDLGQSIFSNQPVSALILKRVEPTLMLALFTMAITVLVAVPLGIVAAGRSGGWVDRFVMGLSVVGFSVPVFVVAYTLVWIFSIKLGWLPVQGYKPLADGLGECLRGLVLPSITLSLGLSALVARVTRSAMLEILAEDYMRTARAKGAGLVRLLVIHALKNAGVPVVTVVGIGFAVLLGGVVVTESIFTIPGIGRLTVDAIQQRDYPIVQGVMLFFSLVLITVNLLVDLSYALFDPRIRY